MNSAEEDEVRARARIRIIDLIRWYLANNMPLDVPLYEYKPGEDEGRRF